MINFAIFYENVSCYHRYHTIYFLFQLLLHKIHSDRDCRRNSYITSQTLDYSYNDFDDKNNSAYILDGVDGGTGHLLHSDDRIHDPLYNHILYHLYHAHGTLTCPCNLSVFFNFYQNVSWYNFYHSFLHTSHPHRNDRYSMSLVKYCIRFNTTTTYFTHISTITTF